MRWSPSPLTRKREIILPQAARPAPQHPIRSESRARLVEAIAKGRHWLGQLTSGQVTDTKEIAKRECCSDRSVRMTISLAFLSPTIVKAAFDGTLPRGLGLAPITGLSPDWERQMEVISFR